MAVVDGPVVPAADMAPVAEKYPTRFADGNEIRQVAEKMKGVCTEAKDASWGVARDLTKYQAEVIGSDKKTQSDRDAHKVLVEKELGRLSALLDEYPLMHGCLEAIKKVVKQGKRWSDMAQKYQAGMDEGQRTAVIQQTEEALTALTFFKFGWDFVKQSHKDYNDTLARHPPAQPNAAVGGAKDQQNGQAAGGAAMVGMQPQGLGNGALVATGGPRDAVVRHGIMKPLAQSSGRTTSDVTGQGQEEKGHKGYQLYFKQGVQKYKDGSVPINAWLDYIQERARKAGLTDEELCRAIMDNLEGEPAQWSVRQRFTSRHDSAHIMTELLAAFGETEATSITAEAQLRQLKLHAGGLSDIAALCSKFEKLYQSANPNEGDGPHKKRAFEDCLPDHMLKQMWLGPMYTTYKEAKARAQQAAARPIFEPSKPTARVVMLDTQGDGQMGDGEQSTAVRAMLGLTSTVSTLKSALEKLQQQEGRGRARTGPYEQPPAQHLKFNWSLECTDCGGKGHEACGRGQLHPGDTCYNCGGQGHRTYECKSPQCAPEDRQRAGGRQGTGGAQ